MRKKLSDCKKECRVKVVKLRSEGELKQRLISFGILRGSELEVLEYSPTKSTIEIKVANTRVALRVKEADLIEVEKI